jgi:cyclin C
MEVLGKQLKLRQKVIGTAMVYFRRFYTRNSFVDHDPRLVIPTCLYLAAKVEECAMQATKPEDWQVQVTVYVVGMKGLDPTFSYEYSDILDFEFTLLEELDFYLVIYHPYRPLTQ